MKKKLLVSAMIVMAMSAMFVACNQNTPTNGCICTYTVDGQKQTERMTFEDMVDYYQASTCAELQSYLPPAYSPSCKAY